MTSRAYKTSTSARAKQTRHRSRMAAQGTCITTASHGVSTHGRRCHACHLVHRGDARTIDEARVLIEVARC